MKTILISIVASFAAGIGVLIIEYRWFKKRCHPLPPGPKPVETADTQGQEEEKNENDSNGEEFRFLLSRARTKWGRLKVIAMTLPIFVGSILVVINSVYFVRPEWRPPQTIENLTDISEANHLVQELQAARRDAIITVGNRSDFESVDGMFAFIVDEQTVHDVFHYSKGQYLNLRSGEISMSPYKIYQGKRIIWVEVL